MAPQPPTDQQRAAVEAGLEELIKYVQLIVFVTFVDIEQRHHGPSRMEGSSGHPADPLLPLGLRHALHIHAERV